MHSDLEIKEASSYTDETSRRRKSKCEIGRVWTHAQIGRKTDIHWLHDVRQEFPELHGEMKSSDFADRFDRIPTALKSRVSAGVRKARIHIVDTFAYEAEAKQILRKIYKTDDYEKVLREHENKEVARLIIEGMEDAVTEQILMDSPVARLERELISQNRDGFGYAGFLMDGTRRRQSRERMERATSLVPFKKKGKKSYDTAAKYVSKSGSVFSDAVQFASRGLLGEHEMRRRVGWMLDKSHAYDAGDDKSVDWIEGQREMFAVENIYGIKEFLNPLYGDIDSSSSPRIQAADIAAAIAQNIYDERGLAGMLDKFDYVTFNGEKVDDLNISRITEHWRSVREREANIQKIVRRD